MLAAIVFTDVVGYTVLAGSDEAKAIELFRRDVDLITSVCNEYDGQVLKNTGDGLLMCFSSAVQAVNCAIEVQRRFYEAAKSLPKEDVLTHRIGVHLGDVVVQPHDVIGDGVNVAARIQNEARPGGIAMSQTVYDVVRNKVKTPAVSLGVRHLKHIVEPITVYAIPPIGQTAQSPYLATTPAQEQMMATPIAEFEEPKADGTRAVLLAALAVVVLMIPVGFWLYLRDTPKPAKPTEIVADTKTDTGKGATPPGGTAEKKDGDAKTQPDAGDKKGDSIPPANDGKADGEEEVEMPAESEEAPLRALVAGDAQLRETLAALKKKYDFEGIARWLEEQGYTATPAGAALKSRYDELANFKGWIASQLAFVPSSDPLVIPRAGTPVPIRVWGNEDGSVSVQTQGDPRTMPLDDVQPASMLLIARAALLAEQPGEKKPRVVIRRWMGLFAREYDLSTPRLPRG